MNPTLRRKKYFFPNMKAGQPFQSEPEATLHKLKILAISNLLNKL